MTAMSDSRAEHQAEYKKAILAGGCFWGMQDLIRKQPGVVSHPGRLHRRPERERDLPQSPGPRRGDRDHLRPVADRLPQPAGVLLPDPRSDHEGPAGQRRRHQLPVGDLLCRRRAEARRAGHHRRRRGVGAVAGQGGHRGDAGERLLGSRARAPGLPRALPERVHLPLPAARLEAAEARAGPTRMGPRGSWGQGRLGDRRRAAAHDDAAAVLRRVGDAPEVDLLVRGVVRLNGEVPQHRS